MAYVEIPILNPVELRLNWEQQKAKAFYRCYCQKFEQSDFTSICVISDEEPMLTLLDENGAVINSSFPVTVGDADEAGILSQYAFNVSFVGLSGLYRLSMKIDNQTYTSRLFNVQNFHSYTRLITYRHEENAFNVIFDSEILFNLRVECEYQYGPYLPKSDDSIYESSYGRNTLLHSETWNNYRLQVGGAIGIPDWLHKIIHKAFGLSYLAVDGVKITKPEGAQWESASEENYNLRGWYIEITEDINRNIYNQTVLTINGKQQISFNVHLAGGSLDLVIFSSANWQVLQPLPQWLKITSTNGVSGISREVISVSSNINNSVVREFVLQIFLTDSPGVIANIVISQDRIIYVTGFNITEDSHEMLIGEEYAVPYIITPSNATNKDVNWISSSFPVVETGYDNIISASGKGQAIVTGTTVDGNYTDSILIIVKDLPVQNLILSEHDILISLNITGTVGYSLYPHESMIENANVSALTSPSGIVSITQSSNGVIKFTALAMGVTTLKVVSLDNPNAYDIATITVIGNELLTDETGEYIILADGESIKN